VTDESPPPPSASGRRPQYKGEPLDADRGPGLGCFWTQVVLLVALLVITPVGVINAWPIWLTGGLLALTLVLVFFTSLTVIFLLRLVAADRRARRAPLRAGATRTVGQLEDEADDAGEARAPQDRDPPA
jgi:hypothetical protein